MELECDLNKINNEELLRKMWQQSEDVNRKKEIRSQLYKLRESRLRDLYQGDIMADNSAAGFGKDPLVTSHGDALADQSFQSLKSKEIRDSLSPTEMRFQSMTLNNPNTTGWNVQSAKEVSPDGRGFRAETVATTDGIESVNGGIAEFKGRNEERSSAHHEGDDKNFVKKALESSNSHLQEKVVIGDENSGRTEVRTSSTKSSSSSQVIQSSTNVEYDNGFPIQQQQPHPQKYLMDANRPNLQDMQQQEQQRLSEEQRIYEQQFQQHQQHLNQQEHHTTEQVSKTQHQSTQQKNVSQNIQTQETHEQNKRYVDMDKASPEYQQHVQHLMQQPGEIISNTVEYPKPNVKMITTVKRLPDGTIVRNKRYETEELTPTRPTTRSTSTPANQTPTRRDSQQPPSRNYQPDSSPHSRPNHDMVDSGSTTRYVQDTHTDDVETKFSSIKKSSSKFSTETTSETIQEFDEQHAPSGRPSARPKPKTDDFSTHGFPSVRADKPTQEYATERPHAAYPSQTIPNKPNAAVVPRYTDDIDNITERRVNTNNGEVIIVSSEKKHNYKTSTNSERIVETERIIHDQDQPHHQATPNKTPQDFSTHGFPSVREPSSQQPRSHPTEKQQQPHEQDFPMDKFPPGTRIINKQRMPPHGEEEEEVVIVTSQKSHTAKHSSNMERIIEHDILRDDQPNNFPRIQPTNSSPDSPYNYTVTTPGELMPKGGPAPSARSPGNVVPAERKPYYEQPTETTKRPSTDYTTQGYPSVATPSRPAAGLPSAYKQHPTSHRQTPSQDYSTQGFPSVRTPTQTRPNGAAEPAHSSPNKKIPSRTPSPNKYKTTNTTVRESTERVIKKEKEVDSAHRAFAASLRSSSPFDHTDYHARHTPRSSVSSNRTFRRDGREGSHESAPSETSRISTTTITRNTPPRAVGGRTVVTKTVTTKTGPGSTDSLNALSSPRATKSPSPGKINTITTTTTTRTSTSKDVPKATDNQHKRITSNKIDSLFPINEPQLTSSITKTKFSDNHKQPHKNTKYSNNKNKNRQKSIAAKTDSRINNASAGVEEVIEAPCLRKHYYKLGPSDQTQPQMNTKITTSSKSPQIPEKSPTKKPSSQPAPSSRSSTTPFSSRKPTASVMTDDDDDVNNENKPSPFSSPSSRSRTPQKILPSNDNDKPQDDDWQTPRQPDSDERRTVHRETTFEKPENEPKPSRKPNLEPNVEWIIVDDHDNDSDSDGFAPETVDAKVDVKRTTTKLITQQQKQLPSVTQKKPKPTSCTTTTTVTTKSTHTLSPSKTQTKPNDKSPLKARPHDSRVGQPTKTSRPLTDTRSPVHSASKTPTKTVAKGPTNTSPNAGLKKPLPKSVTTAETSLRKTSKTSQALNVKTLQFIEAEKQKERKTKPQTPEKRKPKDLQKETPTEVAKPLGKFAPERQAPQDIHELNEFEISERQTKHSMPLRPQNTPNEPYSTTPDQEVCYEPQIPQNTADFVEDIFFTPQPDSPEFRNTQNIPTKPSFSQPDIQKPKYTEKPRQKSPAVRKPPSPGFQKLQMTFDEHSPHFGIPYTSPDESQPQSLLEEHLLKPHQEISDFNRPQEEPYAGLPNDRKVPGKEIPEHKPYTKEYAAEEVSGPFEPDFEPLETDDEEYRLDNNKTVVTSQKTVAKHIQKFETNFLKDGSKSKPQTTKAPLRAIKEPPQTPAKLTKRITKTEEACSSDIEDDTQFENTAEFIINSQQKFVISEKDRKPGPKFTEEPKNRGAKSPQRMISPTRRSHSPDKQVSPKRAQPGQKETTRKQSPQRVISPTRNQHKPDDHFSGRTQSPDKHVSPNRHQPGQKPAKPEEPQNADSKINQKSPEKPYGRRPQSSNKHVSPQRSEKVLNDQEVFVSSLKTTKVVHESVNKFEKPLQPERKHPEKTTKLPRRETSPTKRPDFPEKRSDFVHKHTSPTRSQNKPLPDDNKPELSPKYYPEQVSDSEEDDTIIQTRECVINFKQKQHITDREHFGKKSPLNSTSPTRVKDMEKQPEDKTLVITKTRSPSPNKPSIPTRSPKKPEDNERFTASFKSTDIIKEFIVREGNDDKYQQNKRSPKTEKGNMSPTREPLSKRPQSPKKPLSPTRKPQPVTEDENNFQTSLTITKTVTEKPKKPTPGRQQPNQSKPSETASDEEDDETFIKPKSPLDFTPTSTQRKPESVTKEDEFAPTTFKTTKFVTEKRTTEIDQQVYRPELTPKHRVPHDNETIKTTSETSDSTIEDMVKQKPNEPHRDDSPKQKPKTCPSLNQVLQPESIKPGHEEVIKTSQTAAKQVWEKTTDVDTKELTDKPLDRPEDSKTLELTFKMTPHKKPQDFVSELNVMNAKETFVHTSEFTRDTSQKLIETEQKSTVTDSEELPRQGSSPKTQKSTTPSTERQPSSATLKTDKTKSITEDDTTFRKSLRKDQNKPAKVKPSETDEEESSSEIEDLLIETCENSYVVEKNLTSEEEQTKFLPTSEQSVEGPNRPKDAQPQKELPFEAPLEPWLPKQVDKRPTDLNKQFIESERVRKETPDGAFISKTLEPSTPTSPTFRKKGTGRSDTFEERCRQILGMENYGDTQGTFKKQPVTEVQEQHSIVTNKTTACIENDSNNTTVFQVKIEDCDEAEETLSSNRMKKTAHKQTHFPEKIHKQPQKEEPKGRRTKNEPNLETSPQQDYTTDQKDTKFLQEKEDKPQQEGISKPRSKSPLNERWEPNENLTTVTETTTTHKPEKKPTPPDSTVPHDVFEPQTDSESEYEQTIVETTTVKKASMRAKEAPIDHKEPVQPLVKPAQRDYKNGFEQVITEETTRVYKKSSKNEAGAATEPDSSEPETNETNSTLVTVTKKTSRSSSPTKSTPWSPRSSSPTKTTSAPKETPKRKPSKELSEPKSNRKSPQKLDEASITIKDRLRSATRKLKSPGKPDQVDGSDYSSPERSPTRYTERRRSSNISVTTEIVIEHTDSDTPHKKEKSPTIVRMPQDSVYKEIIDSTVLPEKLTRRLPVTERKESAPVHRVTSKEKDMKMSRSTSENLFKIKSNQPHTVTAKTSDHRRPNKCFATKSINLSATDRLINCGDMENVIIDIQHAKSSREPSPDKIVPTPVPAHLDTGKPRYPDVVQEPEDEQPKRKPLIKNIPIFEEESNAYLGCHITEINMERSQKSTFDSLDYEENILENPVVEAPPSLDYISLEKPCDDESLLTVHEKVNKFQNITQKVKKAENPEQLYSPVKLGPSAPQKSPELVRTISRHISRQNEPDYNNEVNEEFPLTTENVIEEECLVDNKKSTKEFKVSHHEKTTETTLKTAEKYQQPEEYIHDHYIDDNDDDVDDDDDELIPHTATHTTIIEERRQKDILSRPSVFGEGSTKTTRQPPATTKSPLKCNKSPVKESEKLRPDNKSRTKPTSAVTNNIHTTAANATTSNKPKQLPQHKNSDIDYEFRGSNIQTGVKNIISKQTTKVQKSSNTSSDSKTNDLKKPTTASSSNKRPAQHTPVRLTPPQHTDEHDLLSADDDNDNNNDDESTMIVTWEQTTDIDTETQVVNEDLNKTTTSKKIPLHKTQATATTTTTTATTHSSTNSSPTERPVKTEQKDHVVKLTDNKLLKSNTVTTSTSIKTAYETLPKADDLDEIVLEPTTKKSPSSSPSHTHTKSNKMSTTTTTTTDSVAARRSLFENNNGSPKRTPLTSSPMSGRRPSYMDHTKSSLEHTRKDSLEINKTNYSRKPSQPDEEEGTGPERNSLVKFDVPQGKRSTTPRATSVVEDIDVEEIFDLEMLESLLESVQSYEIRRRIRAQIRLIKKNQKNEAISHRTTEVTTKTVKVSKVENEEPDTTTTERKVRAEEKRLSQNKQTSSSKKEYIFEEAYHPTTRRSPRPNRYPYEKQEQAVEHKPIRSNRSPDSQPKCSRSVDHSPDKQKHTHMLEEQHEQVHEIRTETSPTRKPHSAHSSPERRHASPDSYGSLKHNKERSRSPQEKPMKSKRETSSRSPDSKTSISSTLRKSSASYEQQESSVKSSKRTPVIAKTRTAEDKAPVWVDRKNILKAPSSNGPKKPSSSTLDSRAGYTKTIKSSTTQKVTSNKSSSFVDDDCVTSSYGIGPTDENGLPLFGIRALKKKKPTVDPSETTEEVTGYVVEEKYYSDNKSKPTLERNEFLYSTNPAELQKLKQQVEVTGKRTSLKDMDLKETREAALISKATPALRSSPEDDFLDSTTKYVRRGSVKEMSEKFIQKEASAHVTEKTTNNYPKAGLILRTSSRKSSRDMDSESENYESFKSTRVQQHTSSALADSDDNQYEYEVEEVKSRHSGRFITESESECDSIKTQREFKKVTSSSSSSMATRSFLNSQGEEKVVTNVSDCLERMRNADNVVEEGDTAEDQEARALLNKFLGASIIMKGAESSLPATNRQSKIIATTTTSSNLNDDNDGDNNAKHEVKTTRITKTITSGSSSAPVTYTTCDIEEIWDEEILKELLEQARTYEERRKIRSRLRELMADREETKKSLKGDEKIATAAAAAAAVEAAEEQEEEEEEEEESSASEYEEIIEEVTDYSEAESEVDDKQDAKVVSSEKSQEKVKAADALVTKTESKSISLTTQPTKSLTQTGDRTDQTEESRAVTKTEIVVEEIEEEEEKVDSSAKGECLKPMVHDKPIRTPPQALPGEHNAHGSPPTNSKKQKLSQDHNIANKKSKATVTESSSRNMYASYNNSNLKSQKAASSTASTTNPKPVVAVHNTPGRADSTSISTRNNNNTNTLNSHASNSSSNSGSGSLGGNPLVVGNSGSSPRQVARLGVPQKEDSGTESGEDLRLIAAGLRDQLQIQNDSNIIEDVTCALSRLENSLKEGKDISIDTEKRKALLALVARLRAGLTSPEKLAEIAAAMSELDGNEGLYGETSSPEADAHRSNRNRFGKRKNRVNRHTVGVSREELADARRYMEDMLLMSNISQSTTPDATNNTPPQWYPLEKNASTGALPTPPAAPVLQRPKKFVPEEKPNAAYTSRLAANNGKRRPLSGEYSVSFESSEPEEPKQGSAEESSKGSRFTNKKHLMKRANTIDLAKTHKYNPEFDTDSDAEDKATNPGLKRAVQVSVKKRVQNVVPPFEPKTENDRKFLAFINKQSDRPGLGWTTSRSVSNWTNKFGSIKSTFEGGLVGKPPQAPHHVTSSSSSSTTKTQQISKLFSTQPSPNNHPATSYISNQQIALRLQREAERQSEDRRRKLEKEHLEYERRERDKLERQRQQRERQERERLEREHFERQRREQDQIAAAQHAALLRNQATKQQALNSNNMPQPIPINEFKHAPQSVFRPIESGESPTKPIYKPIPQFARNTNNWQPLNDVPAKSRANLPTSPGQYGNTRPDNSFITSPPPSARSPMALPWASKPTVDSSSFKSKAHRFEERSKYDNLNNSTNPFVQRHNSLRSSNGSYNIPEDLRKRPSLPNTFDPYSIRQQISGPPDSLAYLPPPQNISFTYSSLKPKTTYQSYPCLPLAVASNLNDHHRTREDSLTDPHAVPLVLTSTNPSYCPSPQFQQPAINQPLLQRKFDLVSPADSAPGSPSFYAGPHTDCTDEDFDSDNNLLEYHAVSRVMRKPQSQTAVTVGRRTGHVSDDELYGKNSRAAKNLLSTIKSLGNPNSITRSQHTAGPAKRPEPITSPKTCLSPDGRSYQAPMVEPLFPDINKFEANRQPVYSDEPTKRTFQQPAQRHKMGLYKSLENLNRSTAQTQSNFIRPQPEANLKPYVSETQTSYVVTYPLDDLTDDEDVRRASHKHVKPPNTLDLNRPRHTSENSTGSSTTTSLTYSQNLPSPNTNWTANPIVQEANISYQNTSISYQPRKQSLPSVVSEFEAVSQRHVSSTLAQQQAVVAPASRPSYEANARKQPAQQETKTATTSNAVQKKPADIRRSIEQPVINPKHSNISQEMLTRLDQQRERISTEAKRKSLGNTLDYQMEKQSRQETAQSTQIYKSSAPADTPDIVKSSLPKDETQPILKKFGPPQRHHYTPNSYQSPGAKTTSSAAAASSLSSSVKTTTTHSANMQGRNLHTISTQQTVVKKSQQILNSTKPTIMETPATPQPDDDYIPRNIVYNNVHAFSSMSRRQEAEGAQVEQQHALRPSKLSKSDSWNQIMMLQSQHTPTNTVKYNQSPTNELRRTKSGHTLAIPKMFEAAMTKTDITEKQKTVAAYFSGQKSPTQHDTLMEQQTATKRSVINRTKTSEKVSAASRKSLGSSVAIVPVALQRSATMPHIANVHMLDESNVEDAFEQLMMEQKQQKSTSSTTEKTETKEEDGAVVTTTTKVTTRTVTGSAAAATAAKPVTPFAKFKQLDKQNSQQSAKSPTTPTTTTTGGGSTASPASANQPIFKFTDPALNAKAATVKEQLLQWCQSKTQEYENIEITNFSTSWNNGLAFCALIHHFLPDAFDYSQLTPKNRRKNFELAFTVADEKAGIAPLLDVEDMVVMQRPDWKCVFVYVQSIYRRFRNCQ